MIRHHVVTAAFVLGLSVLFAGLSVAGGVIAWLNIADSGAHPSFLVGGAASAAACGLLLRWSAEGILESVRQLRLARRLHQEEQIREIMES